MTKMKGEGDGLSFSPGKAAKNLCLYVSNNNALKVKTGDVDT